MDALIGIVAGFFLGSIFSVVIMSLCVTSKRSDKFYSRFDKQYDDFKNKDKSEE